MSRLLQRETTIDDKYLPLAMSIIGDQGDDVDGVNGVGPVGFLDIFDQLIAMTGNLEQMYDKVESNKDLFDFIPPSISNKKLNSVVQEEIDNNRISINLKLVSFELLSRALDNPSTTDMIDKREYLKKRFSNKQVSSVDAMKTALSRNGVVLEESSIDFLYI